MGLSDLPDRQTAWALTSSSWWGGCWRHPPGRRCDRHQRPGCTVRTVAAESRIEPGGMLSRRGPPHQQPAPLGSRVLRLSLLDAACLSLLDAACLSLLDAACLSLLDAACLSLLDTACCVLLPCTAEGMSTRSMKRVPPLCLLWPQLCSLLHHQRSGQGRRACGDCPGREALLQRTVLRRACPYSRRLRSWSGELPAALCAEHINWDRAWIG